MTADPSSAREWERLVEEAAVVVKMLRTELPVDLQERADNIPVSYERVPSRALVRDGVEPDTMGLFVGGTFQQEMSGEEQLPPQILLYLENIWEEAGHDPETYRFEVRQTLLHELGHYLGLGEDDLEARNLS